MTTLGTYIIIFDVTATVARSIYSQMQTVKRDFSRPECQQIVDPGSNTVPNEFQENCITAEETVEDLVSSVTQSVPNKFQQFTGCDE